MSTDRLKYILLAVFLILEGLVLLHVGLGGLPVQEIAGICGIVAGILFIINR